MTSANVCFLFESPRCVAVRLVGRCLLALFVFTIGAPLSSMAQTSPPDPADSHDDSALRFRLPVVTVTAQKAEDDKQKIPVSVTAVPKETIESAHIYTVGDATLFSPNTYFTDWSARKLSIARFRGISSSQGNNPSITTYIDGVPQLHTSSSSITLLDVEQIEFVRGPQGALFGRNTLGGLVNISSVRPSVSAWTGSFSVPFGNHGKWGVQGGVSGPVVKDKVSVAVSFGQLSHDGFNHNVVTGNEVDERSAFSAKGQLLWTPNDTWESRVIFTSERARDGDYTLHDVAALRAHPDEVARDFEGSVDRDVIGTTVLVRRLGGPVEFSSTTGLLSWETRDLTDLDYTPLPILRRDNSEEDFQFTQEFRFASTDSSAIRLSQNAVLGWQAGVSFFNQGFEQDSITSYSPFVIAPFAVDEHSPRAELDDFGLGFFGQGTFTFNERTDLIAGARFDYENKTGLLEHFFEPAFPGATSVDVEESFSNVSPQLAVSHRLQPDKTVYATVGRGYKAGGFNAVAPAGDESFDEEHSWHFEGGAKTMWANGRASANVALFFIDWQDLQVFVPHPLSPVQFYLRNVGGATSRGVEFELGARPAPGVDVFTAIGFTSAKFSNGSFSNGVDVSENDIPNTPGYTASAGLQYSREIGTAHLHGRADLVFYDDFLYDDANTLGQEAYSLVNLGFGVTVGHFVGEFLVRNAFDTEYIPLAFNYPNFAPSGFVGEMGTPRAIVLSAGVRF